ncbi:phosphopantetheine-binding protein [Acanthopleuribacter pedis]|uniref:Carrier domain-containing protein n=1 Tax=Acanthopleuribacter pedis TaxID=442870 RepID=A0A8J7QDF5_9BACT|nr:phosphopantetheine-binding protein [Acanthopleuribacter pedis]MBO1322104.1 hypothetical protein [Acanthopleuribacter pedis]
MTSHTAPPPTPDRIAALAARFPNVAEAHVHTLADPPTLAAYLVPLDTLDTERLKTFMAESLPEHHMPDHFVQLEKLPLLENGAIHTAALPDPRTTATAKRDIRSLFDSEILAIWEDVLGRDDVGIDDDFFALGGDAEKAGRLCNSIRHRKGTSIDPDMIADHPTVAQLADYLLEVDPGPVIRPGMKRSEIRHARQSAAMGDHWHTATRPGPFDDATTVVTPNGTTLDTRKLFPLIQNGELEPVKTITLENFANESRGGLTDDEIFGGWCDYKPVVSVLRETPWGRVGAITLPRFDKQLFGDPEGLRQHVLEALHMARAAGADTVSLSGLMAVATDYGRLLEEAVAADPDLPRLAIAQDTEVAALYLGTAGLLARQDRDLAEETLGLLGLDPVGTATVGLLLAKQPHPKTLILCDPENRDLTGLQTHLDAVGYQGEVRRLTFKRGIPSAFYKATLMLATSDMKDILRIDKLKPGTLLVAESTRPCFKSEPALVRMEDEGDIQAMEGDILRLPKPSRLTRYLPIQLARMVRVFANITPNYPEALTGNQAGALLHHLAPGEAPLRGPVTIADAERRLAQMQALNITAAAPHLGGQPLEADLTQPMQRGSRTP